MTAQKIFYVLASAVLAAVALLATLGPAQAQQPAFQGVLNVRLADSVALDGISVDSDRALTFRGQAEELDGGCLPVRVYVEGERGAWWPVYRCVDVGISGEWSLRVPSDDSSRPVAIQLMAGE